MHTAYAIINTLPIFILTLTAIGIVCYIVGQLRAEYLWNQADLAHDDVDASKYYVHMLFSAAEKKEEEFVADPTVPSLEELTDMNNDLAEVAANEYDEWVKSLDADLEYQEREERRILLIRAHRPAQVTFGTMTPVGTMLGVGAVG